MRTVLLLIILATAACGPGPHRPATQGRPVLELARAAVEPNANAGLSSEASLVGITRASVPGEPTFEVAGRTAHIARFPCSRCHDRALALMRPAPGKKAAHWEIALKHAPDGVMSCESCHQVNQETDSLHSLRGTPISFDQSYQLCAQCHSRQVADWKGGAHGKRLGGWAPPRVVENCTGCHNPHQPRFAPRWPSVTTPVKPGKGKHE